MTTARSIWIAECLVSLALLAVAYDNVGEQAGAFVVAELALFAVAFLLAVLLGRPGKVLVAGTGLGVAFAIVLAVGASGDSCGEGDLLCFTPGDVFAIGLILAGALYPGWALGTGVGALARLSTRGREQRA